MPLYEYICDSCGDTFSKILKMINRKDPIGGKCGKCGGDINQFISSGVPHYEKHPKVDSDFRYKLAQIKKANRGSTVHDG